MKRVLVVTDMQNDFISGALGSPEAREIVSAVRRKIQEFPGTVFFLKDTHGDRYLDTSEGKKLPVPHCIKGTWGWELEESLEALITEPVIEKDTFGSGALGLRLAEENKKTPIEEVVVIGLCTDICVISNALLIKAFLPQATLSVDAACCAGVSPQAHQRALEAMAACQIEIRNNPKGSF